jgi:hypothetical protein
MVRRKGFEPLTPRFEVWCSIQLSYRRLLRLRMILSENRCSLFGIVRSRRKKVARLNGVAPLTPKLVVCGHALITLNIFANCRQSEQRAAGGGAFRPHKLAIVELVPCKASHRNLDSKIQELFVRTMRFAPRSQKCPLVPKADIQSPELSFQLLLK